LIQHDSSYHRWSPYVDEKWWLITSLDDYSRYMLYADIVEKETTWKHITALESVWLRHGFPFKYYVDSHSIFRLIFYSYDTIYPCKALKILGRIFKITKM